MRGTLIGFDFGTVRIGVAVGELETRMAQPLSVIDGEESLTASGVSEFLRGRVSAYKIPREFIFSASLPREDSGKIKKRLLRDAYVAGDLH